MCRAYLERPVPRATVLRILEATRRAPSAGHSQGVRLAVVSNAGERQRIAQAFGEERFVERGLPRWLSTAPVHVVVAHSLEAYRERYALPDKSTGPDQWGVSYPVLDSGKALMILYMAAEECGLSCGYLGPHAGPDLVEMLDLPSDWIFSGLVTLGYRDRREDRTTRSQRLGWREFDEVVRWL